MRKQCALKRQGKFWPQVRALIWEKAQQLYQQDEARGMSNDLTGTTATKAELARAIFVKNYWRIREKSL